MRCLSLRLAAGLALATLGAACGGEPTPGDPDPSQVEIALYVAIQNGAVDVEKGSEQIGRPPLQDLYDITCRKAAFDTWACSVLLADESTVACTIDRARRVGREAVIEGQPRCKY
jgi:hypothetical protein